VCGRAARSVVRRTYVLENLANVLENLANVLENLANVLENLANVLENLAKRQNCAHLGNLTLPECELRV